MANLNDGFLITTFNRPTMVLALLKDIAALGKTRRVCVVDDASTEDYAAVHAFVEEQGWSLIVNAENHGRLRFVENINQGLAVCRSWHAPRVWILQDDVRLSQDQFTRALDLWESLPKPKRGSLVLYTPEGAPRPPEKVAWTNAQSVELNERVDEVFHIDTSVLVAGPALESIRYHIPLPDPSWLIEPKRSSGYGKGISLALAERKYRMYRSVEPLVDTVVAVSQMHHVERQRNPRLSAKSSSYQFPVIATMATYPKREKSLPTCVASLLPQVDLLYVWCNEYTPDNYPECLKHPKIVVRFGENLTDTGKFAFDNDFGPDPVYHFACDDDLVYPVDYVRRMVLAVESAERKAIICVHGRLVPATKINHFYKDTICYHGHRNLATNQPVHIPATCLTSYFTGTIRFGLELFKAPKMTDIWVGVHAKNCEVPVVCIAHKEGWITTAHHGEETIYDTEFKAPTVQTRVVNENMPWPVPEFLLNGAVHSSKQAWDLAAKARRKAAALPDAWGGPEFTRFRPMLVKLIRRMFGHIPKGQRVLDFGCGFGRWAPLIEELGYKYVGVDTSAGMLALEPSPSRTLWVEGTPLPKADAVFIFDVFKHLPLVQVRKVVASLVEAAPRIILIEEHNAIGIDGTLRADYGPQFFAVSGCDSVQTGRVAWNAYRGNLS